MATYPLYGHFSLSKVRWTGSRLQLPRRTSGGMVPACGKPQDDGGVNHRPQEDVMQPAALLDRAGRRRSPATTSSLHLGLSSAIQKCRSIAIEKCRSAETGPGVYSCLSQASTEAMRGSSVTL